MSVIKKHIIQFPDFPNFKPNLTPVQIFALGSFGGSYWRPIYSSVTNKKYKVDINQKALDKVKNMYR